MNIQTTFKINSEVYRDFKKLCIDENIDISKMIEKLIVEKLKGGTKNK